MPWGVIKRTYTVPELKYVDTIASGSVSGAGAYSLLNGLNLGTSAITRVGRQIMMKSFHLKLLMSGATFAQTPTAPMSAVRIMVVYDLQPNGVTPAASDLLENATTGNQVVSSTALRYAGRFKILFDKRYNLNNQLAATTTTTFSEVFDEMYQKINLKTIYANTNNGDITDIDTGAMFLFLTTESGAAANDPIAQFYMRIRYTDN